MRLLPRNDIFFELFTRSAAIQVAAAGKLRELFAANPDQRNPIAETIKTLERQADEITHDLVNRVDRSFVTPLDREDIHLLGSRLDDIIDRVDGLARRSMMFHLGEPPEGVTALAAVVERSAKQLEEAVRVLPDGKTRVVLAACLEVKRLEEEGDALYHHWMGRLFDSATDPLYVLKWKEIYDTLEKTLDEQDDVANVLESVAIKHG